MGNNLDSYLAAIEAELGDIPAARKREFMDEARAHLWAMVEAKRADGLSEEAAWQSAMAEFGESREVGRALRQQWADSAQLESEGAPLSTRRKLWIFALPVVGCVLAYALFTLMLAPESSAGWQMPVLAIITFGCITFGISSDVRKRGGWKPSTIVGCFSAVIITSNALFNLSGGREWGGEWRSWGTFAFVMTYASLYFWLYKRERANRPWQWNARFKQSPVAAEQEYRLAPLVGLAMGTVLSCIGLVSIGLQFFGLPFALLSCAGLVGGALVLGRWLTR